MQGDGDRIIGELQVVRLQLKITINKNVLRRVVLIFGFSYISMKFGLSSSVLFVPPVGNESSSLFLQT